MTLDSESFCFLKCQDTRRIAATARTPRLPCESPFARCSASSRPGDSKPICTATRAKPRRPRPVRRETPPRRYANLLRLSSVAIASRSRSSREIANDFACQSNVPDPYAVTSSVAAVCTVLTFEATRHSICLELRFAGRGLIAPRVTSAVERPRTVPAWA